MTRFPVLRVISAYIGYLSRRNKIVILSFSISSAILTILELLAVWLSVQIVDISSAIAQDKEIPSVKFVFLEKILEDLELTQKLFFLAFATFLIFLLRSIFQLILNRRLLQSLGKAAATISAHGIKNLVKHNIIATNHNKLSELEYSLTTGIDKAILTIIGSFSILISDALLIIVIAISLFVYDIPTAIVLITFGVMSFTTVNKFATKKLRTIGRKKTSLDITLSGVFRDTVSIAGEARNTKVFSDFLSSVENKRLQQGYLYSLQTLFPYISKYVLELGFLFFAGVLSAYKLAIGTIADAASALGLLFLGGSRLTPALLRIQQSTQAIAGALGPAEQALQVLRLGERNAKHIQTVQLLSPPNIYVEKLNFGWSMDNLLITNLTAEILPNQLTCVVGKSGIGKTTFVRLLMGEIQPLSGEIKFISDSRTSDLESRFLVYVPQEPHLLHDNLARNLFLSQQEFENRKDEISNMCSKLNLSIILRLINDSSRDLSSENEILGELSKGEKQRLGIIRALLQKSFLYILDEPTSALDSKTASAVIDLIKELSERATVVVVAHDEKVISRADKIIDISKHSEHK